MNKLRVSLHCGKKSQKSGKIIRPPHNDTEREKNENVKEAWVDDNIYFNIYDGEYTESDKKNGKKVMAFKDVELKYYQENYSLALDAQNEKYTKNRQYGRIKKMDDWLDSPKYAPTETILRVGNVDDGFATRDQLIEMFRIYLAILDEWNKENGGHMKILDWALHADEYYVDDDGVEKQSSPHIHLRTVWDYYEENILKIGIEKALEQAEIDPPIPYADMAAKKATRYNNRKITFDKTCREAWQEIAKDHGYDIETVPRPERRKSLSKEGFVIVKKADKAIVRSEEREKAAAVAIEKAAEATKQAQIRERIARAAEVASAAMIKRTQKFEAELQNQMDVKLRELQELEKRLKKQKSDIKQNDDEISFQKDQIESNQRYIDSQVSTMSRNTEIFKRIQEEVRVQEEKAKAEQVAKREQEAEYNRFVNSSVASSPQAPTAYEAQPQPPIYPENTRRFDSSTTEQNKKLQEDYDKRIEKLKERARIAPERIQANLEKSKSKIDRQPGD